MSENKTNQLFDLIINEEDIFLDFLRSKFPFFHKSNFFLRDLEYGIKSFFERKNVTLSISDNLRLSSKLGNYFENKSYFVKVNDGVWKINLPQYITTKPGDPF